MSRLRAFGAFWYDFVVGDDWRLALTAAVALALCGLLSHLDVASWWLVPSLVVAALTITMLRMPLPAGDGDRDHHHAPGSLGLPAHDQVNPIAEVDE